MTKKQTAVEQPQPIMKTLANCNPYEFIRQTNKIRHAAAGLMKTTGVMEIRKRKPEFTGGETDEEKQALWQKQARENVEAILDALMDDHAEETANVLGMMCFMEPDEVANAKGVDFLVPALEILNSKAVMDFLSSLARLGLMSTDG